MNIEIPLFPLNVVLFPGMQLPLHIFEPRYRLMIQRCLEGDRTFGVSLIATGTEGEPGTTPEPAGCSCEIMETTPFPDGRMNLLTVGRRRFRVLDMREEDDYLIGTIEWIDDAPAAPSAEETAGRVQKLLLGYLTSMVNNSDTSKAAIEELDIPTDPYELSMWVAALIVIPNDQKQQLLVLDSTEERLELEYQLLSRAAIIQRAYEQRAAELTGKQTDDSEQGPFAPFASLN